MPGPISQSANDAMREMLMQRERIEQVMPSGQPLVPQQGARPMTPMATPEGLAILGSLADAASTYGATKYGGRVEDNPSMQASSPARIAANVAGSGVEESLLRQVARRLVPNHGAGSVLHKVLDMVAANNGAQGIGLAGNNIEAPPLPAATRYQQQTRDAVTRQRR